MEKMIKKTIAGFFIFSLFLSSCSLKYKRELLSENSVPEISFENISLKRYSDNAKTVELTSELLEQYKDTNLAYARNVSFNSFDSSAKINSTGKAALLGINSRDEVYTVFDGIEFVDLDQEIEINGDSLKWNGKSQQLVSAKDKEITIKKDSLVITGKSFSASAISNTFLFSDSVHGQNVSVKKQNAVFTPDESKELSGEENSEPEKTEEQKKEDDDKIIFSGDSMQGRVSNSKKSGEKNSTLLSGNAFIKTSTMQINADSIELSGEDFDTIKAKGNIKGVNSESELEFTADTLEYSNDSKLVILSGNVELKDVKNSVTAKAQIIEYDQNTDVAIMQIDVELTQKQNVCSGAYSIYRKKEQTLELNGNASVKQGKDNFRAQSIKFNMETEEIVMDGNIRGSVVNE